jgi:nucleotide-binding universal stress UspA family protein
MTRFRRILAPTDFSSASTRALRTAAGLARAEDGHLIVAYVLPSVIPFVGDGYVSPATYADLEAAARRAGRRRLDAAVGRLAKAGVKARGLLLVGTAAEQIAGSARRYRADVIVMGTHGRSGLSRFLLGSVAQRVLTLAPCPVLTVRGRSPRRRAR